MLLLCPMSLLHIRYEDLDFAKCLDMAEVNSPIEPNDSILLSEIEAVYRVVGVYGAM